MPEQKTVRVKSALPANKDGGFPIAIYDKNDAYKLGQEREGRNPDLDDTKGELFIADDEEHLVADTPAVRRAISEGKLEEVGADAGPKSDEEDEEGNRKEPAPPSTFDKGKDSGKDKR